MKITLDIPDITICAYFCYIKYTSRGALMGCTLLASDDLCDGNEIKIPREDKYEVQD